MNEVYFHEQEGWERCAYERLVVGIVERAVLDYKMAIRCLKSDPKDTQAQFTKQDCELFFLSPWFSLLTNLDGKLFFKKVQREII